MKNPLDGDTQKSGLLLGSDPTRRVRNRRASAQSDDDKSDSKIATEWMETQTIATAPIPMVPIPTEPTARINHIAYGAARPDWPAYAI